jgi:hypothetical protein
MKLKKISAVILSAALLLCSCGNAETEESGGGRITRNTETTEAVDTETNDAEELDETAEENEKTAEPAEDVTYETAVENAEIVYTIAEELFELVIENDSDYTHMLFIGSFSKNVSEMPEMPDTVDGEYVENAMNFLANGKFGGYYVFGVDEGEIITAIWTPSLNSTLVGAYPDEMGESNDMMLSSVLLYDYEYDSSYIADSKTQSANANAKLVFQNAATYMTKLQIAGASMDSLLIYGSIGKKIDEFPKVETGAELTGDDLTNALRYYMGGDNAGVYVILLDEQLNPRATLWAADEETSIVGAFPVSRTVYENESGNINTADIYEAAGDY